RVKLDQVAIDEYVELLERALESENGYHWPFKDPVEVYNDGENFYLVDGYHRVAAVEQVAGKSGEFSQLLVKIPVKIQNGSYREAILAACKANCTHGVRRTQADKRRSVMMLLNDSEWSLWSDRQIARECNVSNRFVSNVRKELEEQGVIEERDQVIYRQGGTTTKMVVKSQKRKGRNYRKKDEVLQNISEQIEIVRNLDLDNELAFAKLIKSCHCMIEEAKQRIGYGEMFLTVDNVVYTVSRGVAGFEIISNINIGSIISGCESFAQAVWQMLCYGQERVGKGKLLAGFFGDYSVDALQEMVAKELVSIKLVPREVLERISNEEEIFHEGSQVEVNWENLLPVGFDSERVLSKEVLKSILI
ncbi:MAG: hypothetical protein ACRC37_08405, partial [Lentisphaeria bacterium]